MLNPTTRARGRKPAHGEPVVDRALRLLAAFEENAAGTATTAGAADTVGRSAPASLTLTQLSARAGLSLSTTLRLARRLVAWGALERTSDGAFVVGLRLLEVASLSPRGHGLRAAALPFMEDLHHATGQHVLLAVRDEQDAVLVERLSTHRAGRVLFRVGGRLPLHATGVGLVLLAHAPAAVREQALAGALPVPGDLREMSADELRHCLARVRSEGVAVNSLTQPEPMSSVAAPVYDAERSVIAALSVVSPSAELRPASLAPAVIAVARAVSRAVGLPR